MKTPDDIAAQLARQWNNANTREQRLLSANAWPVRLTITKPKPSEVVGDTASLKATLGRWKSTVVGRVIWEPTRYRGLADDLPVPVAWEFANTGEWVKAIGEKDITQEYKNLKQILANTHQRFHAFFVRQRQLVANTNPDELVQCASVAQVLSPGCANGVPLRSLSIEGTDTKFFERHHNTLTRLLDLRFDAQCSELGLEGFLGARPSGENWLLVADLDGILLPVEQMRVRTSELRHQALNCDNLVIVENERCLHLLPKLANTLAILGAGMDLSWLDASWISQRSIAYWGDIDTWGLSILSAAREKQPRLTAIMMTVDTFNQYKRSAVIEPNVAGQQIPRHLTAEEALLYEHLLSQELGRLEQEFLPKAFVEGQFESWAG